MAVDVYSPCAVVSADGARLYSGHIDGALRVWDARTGAHLQSWSDTHSTFTLSALALTDDEAHIVCAAGPRVAVRDLPSGRLRANLGSFRGEALALALLPGGDMVVGSSVGCAAVLSFDGAVRCEVTQGDYVRSVAVSPRGDEFATCGQHEAPAIMRWRVRDGAKLGELGASRGQGPTKIAYSSDGEALFAGYPNMAFDGPTLVSWDLARAAPRWERPMLHNLDDLTVVDDGRRIITAQQDGALRVWDSATGTMLQLFDTRPIGGGPGAAPRCLAPHGDKLFVALAYTRFARLSRDGAVLTADDPPRLYAHDGEALALAFAGDRALVSLGAKGDLTAWDLSLANPPAHASIDGASALRGEKTSVLLRTRDGVARVHGRTLKPQRTTASDTFEDPEAAPSLSHSGAPTLALPDGARALVATPDAVLVVDRSTGETTASLDGLGALATALAVSPSGRVAAATDGRSIVTWKVPS